ncbi:MAG: hypothetical protein QXL94_00180 [Candidatus Parvarchaeum sp.]
MRTCPNCGMRIEVVKGEEYHAKRLWNGKTIYYEDCPTMSDDEQGIWD